MLARQCHKDVPVCHGRRGRDTVTMLQDRLNLLSCAACYFRTECRDSGLGPLSRPTSGHKGRVVVYDKQ